MSASAQTAAALAIAEQAPEVHAPVTLAEALVAALADLTVVEKGRTAKIDMKGGGSYSYDFADLGDVVKKTRPVLARNGLVALTPLSNHGDQLACSVVFVHKSGESLEFGPFPFPAGPDARATGSFITYMRRYCLVAALGMAAGDDDDGAAARPKEPEFVWTHGAVKARLVELFDGDKSKAAEAYRLGHGGEQEPDAALAERLYAEWLAEQPADDPEGES